MEKPLVAKERFLPSRAGSGREEFSFATLRGDTDSVPEFPLPRFQIRSGASSPRVRSKPTSPKDRRAGGNSLRSGEKEAPAALPRARSASDRRSRRTEHTPSARERSPFFRVALPLAQHHCRGSSYRRRKNGPPWHRNQLAAAHPHALALAGG